MREELGLARVRARPDGPRRPLAARADQLLHRRRGQVEGRAWSLKRGQTAWHAAGRIHTDIQDGFVKAEVIGWRGAGRGRRLRAPPATAATLRIEGRDYVMPTAT